MHCQPVHLREELETSGPGGLIALVGGGGKTSLLHALGKAFAESGQSALCTTSTRLSLPHPDVWRRVTLCDDPMDLVVPKGETLLTARHAQPDGDPNKVYGYSATVLDSLWTRRAADWIVVEADGAAGRPLKAPAGHEPVIPSLSTIVIAIIGLGCLHRPFTEETAFRLEQIAIITDMQPGDPITPGAVAKILLHPRGLFKNCPQNAKRLLFCNQSDLPEAFGAGMDLADILMTNRSARIDGMYIGSLERKGLSCLKILA